MRSQIQFVMHPDDEREFAEFLLVDSSIQFVDGPRWPTEEPPTSRNLDDIDPYYCIIWSPEDYPKLSAEYIPTCNDWYCDSEFATLQFLRSQMDGTKLRDGRIAVGTYVGKDGLTSRQAKQDEARYNKVRRYIKKNYTNTVSWDRLWVGPAALEWLHQDPGNCI